MKIAKTCSPSGYALSVFDTNVECIVSTKPVAALAKEFSWNVFHNSLEG